MWLVAFNKCFVSEFFDLRPSAIASSSFGTGIMGVLLHVFQALRLFGPGSRACYCTFFSHFVFWDRDHGSAIALSLSLLAFFLRARECYCTLITSSFFGGMDHGSAIATFSRHFVFFWGRGSRACYCNFLVGSSQGSNVN